MKQLYYSFPNGLLVIFGLISLLGCNSNKVVVRFKPKPPELYSKKVLAQILKSTQNPKIVLRVPTASTPNADNQSAQATIRVGISKKDFGALETVVCNAIEKQLFRSGFTVRDRTLFNEVLRKSSNIDYTTVNGLTDTDFILELVRLNTQIPYMTDKYYQQTKKGEVERVLSEPTNKLTLYGGLVEFKLIHVRTNEIVGNYLFNYVPCLEGCFYQLQPDGRLVRTGSVEKEVDTEVGKPDYLERFLTRATQQLVQAIKQTPAAVLRIK